MPFLLRKPPYARVNCGGEMRDQEEAEKMISEILKDREKEDT